MNFVLSFVNCTFSLLRASLMQHSKMVRIFVSENRLPEIEAGLLFSYHILSCPPYLITLHSWRPWVQGWIVDMFERGGSVEILVKWQHGLDWEIWNSFFSLPCVAGTEDGFCCWCHIFTGTLVKWSFAHSCVTIHQDRKAENYFRFTTNLLFWHHLLWSFCFIYWCPLLDSWG